MSINTTDDRHVALYDYGTGQVIGGPLFDSVEHAEDYVEWAGDRLIGGNPKVYPPATELVALQRTWEAVRLDEDGELIDVEAREAAREAAEDNRIAAAEWHRHG